MGYKLFNYAFSLIFVIGGIGLILKPGQENIENLKNRFHFNDSTCRLILGVVGLVFLISGIIFLFKG